MNKTQRTNLAGLIITATLAIMFFLAGVETKQFTPAIIFLLITFVFAMFFIHEEE